MRNVKEAMAIGREIASDKKDKKDNRDIGIYIVAKKKFRNWCIGIAVSLLPLLALPFAGLFGHGSFCKMFYDLFCDASIVYVGISFTITALNDFTAKCIEKDKEGWVWGNFILLLLGVIIYVTMIMQKANDGNMKIEIVFIVDLIYFLVMLFLTASQYIREIRETRK